MNFNLDRWVGHITENAIKQISEAFSKRLKDTGVTRIQWIAMFYINKHEMISPRELSKIMNVQDSSATRLIERMEKEELIEKIPSEKDKRVTFVKLTSKGNSLFKTLIPYGDEFNNELIEGIDEEELEVFERVLHKMIENISKKG